MSSNFNLNTYLEYINVPLNLPLNLSTLALIQINHLKYIPFENLDVVDRKNILIDIDSIYNKIIINKRGGYCFEMNALLKAALVEYGFNVKQMMSRVRWTYGDKIMPFTHTLLLVKITDNEEYFVDVGFGAPCYIYPISNSTEEDQNTPYGKYKVQIVGDYRRVVWFIGNKWEDLYDVLYQESYQCDLEMSNWYSCSYPTARWMGCLFVCKLVDGNKHMILNNEFIIRNHLTGELTKTPILNHNSLMLMLKDVFGICFEDGKRFDNAGLSQPWILN